MMRKGSEHFLEDVEEFRLLDESIAVLVDGADELVDLVGVGEAVHVQLREDVGHEHLHLVSVEGPAVVGVVPHEYHVHYVAKLLVTQGHRSPQQINIIAQPIPPYKPPTQAIFSYYSRIQMHPFSLLKMSCDWDLNSFKLELRCGLSKYYLQTRGMLTSLLGRDEQEEEVKNKQKSTDFCFCFHAKEYFDVEEEEIFSRIRSAITLRSFGEVLHEKPDLYGPFWIATTLIVVIIAASSLLNFFYTPQTAYNFDKLSVAASLIYGIAFGCPYIIAVLVRIFGGLVSVVDLMCIYGYSLTAFLPITALCFIKSVLIQTALLFAAFFLSTAFLVKGILSLGSNLGQKEKGVLTVFIVGVQILLVFMYKFYFFDLF